MDESEFEIVDWQTFYSLCLEAADKVKRSKKRYDAFVGISRGGLVPLRILSDELEQENLFVIRVVFYEDIKKTATEPIIKDDIKINVKGLKLLVIDDVSDSGRSLKKVIEYLRDAGAKEVDSLTIFYKPHSEVIPTFYVRETKKWIVFPHERRETILKIIEKEKNKPMEKLREDLINIGFEPYVVDRVLTSKSEKETEI
ncbi:MAG: phosphoribosyltransferase family protein [Thermoproteota archaeon]|nr:phosphoribosyltransferase [Candidatus Brockarchaeota archaeon]MBO3762634.1 phosphoribosyltransferase [Candidatus Brockarchaeota archaeon]MBO3768591.1 phosphoribosyltransferase [Candidatus Brockarchaeota archaeon]MBO3800967.1 phosphoribosyltransferase [Candidatus Brockarchaeota archaeon]